MDLATPGAFEENPGLVWQFYSYRRHMALNAQPNKAHYALAELARKKEGFLTLSQNVDGLSPRANHPADKLHLLHGSLFDVRCTEFYCKYTEKDNFTDPIVPALAIPTEGPQPAPSTTDKTGAEATESLYSAMKQSNTKDATPSPSTSKELDISDISIPIPKLAVQDLPHCPKCKEGLLRPGVVWFGEMLPLDTIGAIDEFIRTVPKIDLMLVIGTSAKVYPAAGYVDRARKKGARVAVVNVEKNSGVGLMDDDWFFEGDAGVVVPEILKSVIGEIGEEGK